MSLTKRKYNYSTVEEGAAILRSLGYITWYHDDHWVAAHLPIRHRQENYTNYGRTMWECFWFEEGMSGEEPVTGQELKDKQAYIDKHVAAVQALKDSDARRKHEDEQLVKEFQTSAYWKGMKRLYKKYTDVKKAFETIERMSVRGIY